MRQTPFTSDSFVILDSVCKTFGIKEKELKSGKGGRRISEARRIAAVLLAMSGFLREEIAEILKFADGSGVTKTIRQHEQIIASNSSQDNMYLKVFVQALLTVNEEIAKNYAEIGLRPLPVPDFGPRK